MYQSMASLREGEKDKTGNIVEKIVFKDNDYVVYWIKGNHTDAIAILCRKDFSFSENIAKIKQKIINLQIPNRRRYKFMRISLADAFYYAFSDNENQAVIILENLYQELSKKINLERNIVYILGMTVPTMLLCIALFISLKITVLPLFKYGLICMIFSNLGSILNNINIILNENRRVTLITGFFEFIKSSISGVLVYLLIQSNMILGSFANNSMAQYIFCFISGFNDDITLKLIYSISRKFIYSEND